MRNPTTCGNITTSAWAKKKPSPTSEPGQAMFELDGDRNRHEAELAHVFDLVVVQVSLSDLPVLTAQDLHGLAHNLLVGRRDDAHRSFEGTRVNTLHRDLLDDPGAAHDFVTNRHLAVWKALEPAQRVCGGVSRAIEVHFAGRLERDLGCVEREQRPLIVGIERGNELDGGVFGLSHCVSSFGVTAKRGPRLLPPCLAGQPEGAQAPTSVHETSRSIAQNGYGHVLISEPVSRPRLLSVAEAAAELKSSEAYVRRLLLGQRLYGIKVGPVWAILPEDLEEFKRIRRRPGRPRKAR